MKKKLFLSISIALIALIGTVYAVYAFKFGNIDGVWGLIDGGGGASYDRWATGPTLGDPDQVTGLHVQDSWWDQTTGYTNTDWNQVRYGYGAGGSGFAYQSGMAFNGTDEVSPNPTHGAQEPFLMGIFCHINNPIYSPGNPLDSVPLAVTLSQIQCDDAAISGPFTADGNDTPITEMTFSYTFTLDETPNSTPCDYPSDPGNPCADGIFIGQPPTNEEFRCYYKGDPEDLYVDYTVTALGFMTRNTDGSCPDWYAPDALGAFISQEGAINCGCLYGAVTDYHPSSVDLISFAAESTDEGVQVTWATANEMDNLGFNLYRADSLIGEQIQLNDSLILTDVPPGSPFGGMYEFEDNTATGFQTYFYWLEDVEASGETTLHGPVSVIRQ